MLLKKIRIASFKTKSTSTSQGLEKIQGIPQFKTIPKNKNS